MSKETERKERVTRAAAMLKKPEKPGGALRKIQIHPAENGLHVEVERGDEGPQGKVFTGKTAVDDVLAHLENHLR